MNIWQLTKKNHTPGTAFEQETEDGSEVAFRPISGKIVLRRGLLKLTYWPPRLPRRKSQKAKMDVKFHLGHASIECGHSNFKSLEKYPDVLCGKNIRNLLSGTGREGGMAVSYTHLTLPTRRTV